MRSNATLATSRLNSHLNILYNTNITLYILLTDKDFRNLNKYDKYIIDTITWLKIALLYSKIKTSELKIYLYLTDIKKKIPKYSLTEGLNEKSYRKIIILDR